MLTVQPLRPFRIPCGQSGLSLRGVGALPRLSQGLRCIARPDARRWRVPFGALGGTVGTLPRIASGDQARTRAGCDRERRGPVRGA